MHTITVRYKTTGIEDIPAFSAKNFRALTSGKVIQTDVPQGFTETRLPAAHSTLCQTIYLSGKFQTPALCSGLGRCGLCRVLFISEAPPALEIEKRVLSHHDLDAGWRLSCRHASTDGMHVLIPALPHFFTPIQPEAVYHRKKTDDPAHIRAGLAVDLGTTSVHWRFVAPHLDHPPHGVLTNPQMGAGSDVVSRIAYASTEQGTATLQGLVADALREIVWKGLENGIVVDTLCVAANPAMSAILLGQDIRTLTRAPYSLPDPGGAVSDIPGLPPVYVPPHIGPFVGSDISAGYASIALDPEWEPEYPFLLADLGTNGECILALDQRTSLAASLPMGPALEGINLSYGCQAVPGAVTRFSVTPFGLEPVTIGNTAPVGITATGYLSLLQALRATNLIGEDGLFTRPADPLANRIAGQETHESEPGIRLPGKMRLFSSDIEEILKVKAAFSLALARLLAEAGCPAKAVKKVYLAGSLGSHAPIDALVALGFLPAVLGRNTTAAGNTALAGASLFLRNKAVRATCKDWAATVRTLNLAEDPDFGNAYADHMRFVWQV